VLFYPEGMPRRPVMRALRTTSTRRMVAMGLAGVLAAGSGTAIALAATGGSVPPAKPTAVAIHDALTAPAVPGLQADITFTNHIVDPAALQGSDPLLAGAHGRLWASADRRVRLELQSERGDAQIVSDGSTVSLYDPAQNTLYRAKLPARDATAAEHPGTPPSVAEITSKLTELARHATISGAEPSNVAGQPAYTLKVSSIRDGGLLRGAELAWDAARGVPLRAALYSTGNSSPVLEIKATSVSFGSVPASTFDFSPPKGTKVVDLDTHSATASGKRDARGRAEPKPVTGTAAVAKALPFSLRAPATLAGRPRQDVRLIGHGGHPGALVTYGQGLGGIAVLEQPADATKAREKTPVPSHGHGRDQAPTLPAVSINGVPGQELDTALGSLVRFTRGGVTYTVLGSVSPAAAKAAARGL
jgi:outer membrane lipoprotein-sorting protein